MDEEIKDQYEVNSGVAYFEAIAVEKLSRLLASKQYGSFLTDEVIDAFKMSKAQPMPAGRASHAGSQHLRNVSPGVVKLLIAFGPPGA
ncbi:hypothetical protein JET64_17510 [Pseudomonas putida]|nr:hypothetical protein [Pseudomonas putida]